MILASMKGLMEITDKVNQVFQRYLALPRIDRGISERGSEAFNLTDHTLTVRAVPVRCKLRFLDLDIHVMPEAVC